MTVTTMIMISVKFKNKDSMKKYIVLALASLFAFASCSKESVETPGSEETKDEITVLSFTSIRPQLKSESKTAWNGSTIVWSAGDRIRVGYTLDGSWMGQAAASTSDVKFYTSDDVSINTEHENIGTFNVPVRSNTFIDPEISGTYVFYGVFPSTATSSTAANAPEISIEVPSIQTPSANSFDSSGDVMIGKSNALSLTGLPTDPIAIQWSRLVAHADLTFKNFDFDGTEDIHSITLTTNDGAKITGTFTANVVDGSFANGNSNQIRIEGTNLVVFGNSVEAWCCILPVTITSLDVVVETSKATYTRSITGISKTFKQNARNLLSINMSSAERVEDVPEDFVLYNGAITEGDYLIVYDNRAMNATVSSNRLTYEDVDPVDETINTNDKYIIWHIAPSGSYWTVYNKAEGKYAAGTGNRKQAQLLADGTDDKSLWTVNEATIGEYDFINKYNSAHYQGAYLRNNGTHGYACYAEEGTGGPVLLYKLENRDYPALSFSPSAVQVVWEDRDEFVAPTLNNPHNVEVTYSSSDMSVAYIDEFTGDIIIVGNGTTTITAAFAGNELYRPGQATYQITVSGKPAGTIKTVSYTVATTSSVTVSGEAPSGSSSTYSQTSRTAGQVSANQSLTLTLSGYSGKIIKGASVEVHSNKKSGSGSLSLTSGRTTIAEIESSAFNTAAWNGSWSETFVTKELDINKALIIDGETIVLTIEATSNSLYFKSLTLTYEE